MLAVLLSGWGLTCECMFALLSLHGGWLNTGWTVAVARSGLWLSGGFMVDIAMFVERVKLVVD